MSEEIITPKEFLKESPKPFLRPCDYTLLSAVRALETQIGTVEAYNRIVATAQGLLAKIKRGESEPPADCYLNDTTGTVGHPAGTIMGQKVEWIGGPQP